MMTELTHLNRNDSLTSIFDILDRDGGVIVDEFVETAFADQLLTDFTPYLHKADWGRDEGAEPNEFSGLKTKRLHGLVGKSSHFERILLDPLINSMASLVLGKPNTMILSTAELMAIAATETQQMLHRDGDSWMNMPRPHPELLFSMNLALTDFTADNGATVVVPGSHKWNRNRKAQANEQVKVIMPKGSVLLYTGSIIHGGGENTTDKFRVGLYLGLIPGWLRPIENIHVTHSAEALQGLSAAGKERIGHCRSGFTVVV